ncbi:hypothetical protein DPMN_185246 [Dreissena polymorpha]|uniref:G-protein coupled receptors family 1 profile domain-containing protein n=1 Tax=Dreissena polymorpha TaxID=45954 RepID=A0A9D4I745_DREPO|nr:hypothetical protein DPMN_185246 [Dreissena polymorpha]
MWLFRHYTMADNDRWDFSISDESMLKELNDEKSRQYIGLTVYVALVAILGILGNTSALVFYMKQKKQTVTKMLIIALTINDFFTSFFIFTNIYDFFHSLTFPSNAWCKLYYLIIRVFVVNSLLFLSAVGFDRFVLIYQWPPWAIVVCQLRSIKYVICACLTISAVFALRDIWIVELTPVYVMYVNRTITGAHCMPSMRPEVKTIITVCHMLDLSILVAVSILIIVIYSLIARRVATVRNHLGVYSKHFRPQAPNIYAIQFDQHDITSHSEGTTDVSQHVEATDIVNVTSVSSTDEKTIPKLQGIHNVDKQLQSSNRSKRNTRIEQRITMMMFAITAASLLSFVPYFVISFLQTYDHTSSAWEVLAHRSNVINSTLNPFIIGFFNSEFRRFIVARILFCRRT